MVIPRFFNSRIKIEDDILGIDLAILSKTLDFVTLDGSLTYSLLSLVLKYSTHSLVKDFISLWVNPLICKSINDSFKLSGILSQMSSIFSCLGSSTSILFLKIFPKKDSLNFFKCSYKYILI